MAKDFKQINKTKHIHISQPFHNDNFTLHFAGDLICDRYFELPAHTNPGYEICLISSGKGFFKIDEEIFAVGDKQLFITQPLQKHSGWPAVDDPYRILYICFSINPGCSRDSILKEIPRQLSQIVYPVTFDTFQIHMVHNLLMHELTTNYQFSDIIINSLVIQFIALTLRNFRFDENKGEGIKPYENPNVFSTQVIRYINDHLEVKLSLEMISEVLNYSIQHLCRKFKEQTGFSIMEYYNLSRLDKGKEYLSKSDMTVTQVAELLHFNTIHHFSSAFKAVYGTSPIEYRKMLKDAKNI